MDETAARHFRSGMTGLPRPRQMWHPESMNLGEPGRIGNPLPSKHSGESRKAHRVNAPSFLGLRAASAAASRIKSRTRAKDTRPELALRKALWSEGVRYRVHASALPGKPDIIFPAARVAVFCDGDFWHGRDWSTRRVRIASGANSDYWIAKIESNMRRDRLSTSHLQRLGWRVIRVWETDVLRSPVRVASRIIQVVHQRRVQPASRAGREPRKLALAHPSPSRLARTRWELWWL